MRKCISSITRLRRDFARDSRNLSGFGQSLGRDAAVLAVDIEAVIGAEPHPLDPEGDGLTTGELNAANDV